MRSRYYLVKNSNTRSSDGSFYKDILTLRMDKFIFSEPPIEYNLTKRDIERPDLLVYDIYGSSEYDDLLFWLNGIKDLKDVEVGTLIFLPVKKDMENFYLKSRK